MNSTTIDAAQACVSGGPRPIAPGGRIAPLDSLRGLAALAVVLFHYSTRYDAVFGRPEPLGWSFAWGEYGVVLFFMLSGFVISWSLERSRSWGEFAWSRFSRLYPAYWVAIAFTCGVVWLAGLDSLAASPRDAALNFTMIQQLLGARHVDGAYWSLQAELFFYVALAVLHGAGATRRLGTTLTIWLLAALGAHEALAADVLSPRWETQLTRAQAIFNLPYIHLFALGMIAYDVRRAGRLAGRHVALALFCLAIHGRFDSWSMAPLVVVLAATLWAAVAGWATWLAWRPLVWLGLISYPLYLTHQTLGYAVIGALETRGLPPLASLAVAVAAAIGVATAMTYAVERPALRWLRRRAAVTPATSSPIPLATSTA